MEKLILVGGGHVHLYVIKNLRSFVKSRLQVILISSMDKQYYSGMASGFLEGYYSEEEMSLDLNDYCTKHQIKFIKNTVDSFEPDAKTLLLKDGSRLEYDFVSFDVGSVSKINISIEESSYFLVKPLTGIYEIKSNIMQLSQSNSQIKNINIAVLGTGAAGIEIGLAAKTLVESQNMKASLTFVGSKNNLITRIHSKSKKLKTKNHKIWSKINWKLQDPGIEVKRNELRLKSGSKINYDLLILATGVKCSDLFKKSGIKTDEYNFMIVNKHLQSVEYPSIFGGGDCVSVDTNTKIPKNGVYAIRQARILVKNLENAISNKQLLTYTTQKHYLSIIALKQGIAVLVYNNFLWIGKLPFYIKRWIDKNYMKKLKS